MKSKHKCGYKVLKGGGGLFAAVSLTMEEEVATPTALPKSANEINVSEKAIYKNDVMFHNNKNDQSIA